MTLKNKRILFVLLILTAIIGILIALDTYGKANVTGIIDSFEDCAAAGYPITESYPEQCAIAGGESFAKQYTSSSF